MPRPTPYQTRPTTLEQPTDGYRALIEAVLTRAVHDALGRGDVRGDGQPARVQQDARAWLMAERGAAALLELAGLEADVILRQVRRVLDR
jgi:hypothetical protein